MAVVREEILIGSKADTRGFKKAESAATQLNKTVKGLAGTLGLVYGTKALVSFGKQAVKAFAQDEAAAQRLATAVDNLGLSFSQSRVTEFISNLEKSSAIADDILRPAFQSLLTTTGSLTKSQELLNNAIQISRGSGIELGTVVEDLNKGYVGITRGLTKYNTGLTRAELSTKSFNEILGIVLAKSAGSAQAYLETTSFKLDVLTLATNNAKETIGKGLVDALARIGGGSEASDAAKAIDNIAKAVNGVTLALGTGIGLLNKFRQGYTNFLIDPFGTGTATSTTSTNRSASPAGTAARTAQQRAAEAAAAKRAKELAALTKKQVTSQKALTAEQKKQNALKKAGTVFDLDHIQIIAALKGKISEDDKIRLEAQLAILNGNDVLASSLTKQILMAQDESGKLYQFFLAIGDTKIKNPFAFLDEWIIQFQDKLNNLKMPTFDTPKTTVASVFTASQAMGYAGAGTTAFAERQSYIAPATNVTTLPVTTAQGYAGAGSTAMAERQSYIEIKVTGEGDLTNAIAKSLQNQSLSSGNAAYINRRTGGFD